MQKKIKPIKIELKTAEDQARYYFNREFNSIGLDILEKAAGECGLSEHVMQPSDKILVQEYLDCYGNEDELLEDYYGEPSEACGEGLELPEEFIEWVTTTTGFDSWKWDREWYPMWSTLWQCDRFYIDSEYCNVDTLYDMGIGVIDFEDYYYLFICGAGYDFYSAHWVKLFKHIGWIKEEETEEVEYA